MTIRVLVGTLYSNENEFLESRKSALVQTNCIVDQYIVKDLNEFDAHNVLWDVFNSRSKFYDLVVKLDADTIIIQPNLFEKVHSALTSSDFDGIQLSLFDHFSKSSIYGLGTFLPHVEFAAAKSKLFADRAIDRDKYKIELGKKVGFLDDAGFHCRFPNSEQSYRYGLHRWKKKQFDLIRQVIKNWTEEKDPSLAWALVGAIVAEKRRIVRVDYGNQNFYRLSREINSITALEKWIDRNIDVLN
jgi:hypothetical protein